MSAAEVAGARALWGAVVNRALLDALWPGLRDGAGNSSSRVGTLEQRAARSWIGSRDFRRVCALAGLDPEAVEERIRPLFDDSEAARDFLARLSGGEESRRRAEFRGERGRRGPKVPKGALCAVPGCGAVLSSQNTTGVCREHNHAAGYCRCVRCERAS